MEPQGIRILTLHLTHRPGNRFLERKILAPSPEQSSRRGMGAGLTSLSPAAAHRPLSAGSPAAAVLPGVLARCAPTRGPAPG